MGRSMSRNLASERCQLDDPVGRYHSAFDSITATHSRSCANGRRSMRCAALAECSYRAVAGSSVTLAVRAAARSAGAWPAAPWRSRPAAAACSGCSSPAQVPPELPVADRAHRRHAARVRSPRACSARTSSTRPPAASPRSATASCCRSNRRATAASSAKRSQRISSRALLSRCCQLRHRHAREPDAPPARAGCAARHCGRCAPPPPHRRARARHARAGQPRSAACASSSRRSAAEAGGIAASPWRSARR